MLLLGYDDSSSTDIAQWLAISTVANIALVLLLRSRLFALQTSASFFISHSLVNAVVVWSCAADMASTLASPLTSMKRPYSLFPTVLQMSFHFAHIVVDWRTLEAMDWIHHLASSLAVGWLNLAYVYGPLLNYAIFFGTGLPGGVDYALLACVKLGRIHSITEKRINRALNNWVRMPGLLMWMAMAQCVRSGGLLRAPMPPLVLAVQFVLVAGNALFFNERVLANHAESNIRAARLAASGGKDGGKDDAPKGAASTAANRIAAAITAFWVATALALPFVSDPATTQK